VIFDLKEKAEHIPTLAAWHHEAWSHLNPAGSIEKRIEKMQNYLADTSVPKMFVWVEGDSVVGSAGILNSDMDTKPELTPWLASVYVKSDRRNEGIGAALVKKVMQHAQALGHAELFLFTQDKESLYKRIGWETISREEYRGELVAVMKACLV